MTKQRFRGIIYIIKFNCNNSKNVFAKFQFVEQCNKYKNMNFLWNGTVACACIYTSRLASLGEYKHTPQPTKPKKELNETHKTDWRKPTKNEMKTKPKKGALALNRLPIVPFSFGFFVFLQFVFCVSRLFHIRMISFFCRLL